MDFVSQFKELNRGVTQLQAHRAEPLEDRTSLRFAQKAQAGEPDLSRKRRRQREKSPENLPRSEAQEDPSESRFVAHAPENLAATSAKFLPSSKMLDSQLGHQLRLSAGQPAVGRLASALPGHRLESATTGVPSRKLGKLKFD